jgi:hypothetical protein
MTKLSLAIAWALLMFSGTPAAIAQTGWRVEKTIHIGGPGGKDYLTVDPRTHRLYVARGSHTNVIDTETGKLIADLPGQGNAHGIALVPAAGRGFISDGGAKRNVAGAVVIFDLKTNEVLGTIASMGDSDGIIFDPFSKQVLVVSGDGNALQTLKPDIDPRNGKIDPPIALGGSPEFLASDGAGKVFVNLMDKNEVAVVDIAARKVIARWPVAPGGAPVGMSIDTQKHHLFIGCRNPQKLIVMSTVDGKVVAGLPIGSTVDATEFDNGEVFASCRDGSLTVAAESSSGQFSVVQTVKTPDGANTMALDPTAHKIYLPTSEIVPPPAGSTGRGSTKPDSFMIVVVSR